MPANCAGVRSPITPLGATSAAIAEVNGVKLHYVEQGTKGPLILFLHGFPEFWYAWHAQLAYFGDTHFAVAPDLRGYNLSDKPAGVEAYKAKHLMADVLALGAHYAKGKFTLEYTVRLNNAGRFEHAGESVPFYWGGALLESSPRSSEPQGRSLPERQEGMARKPSGDDGMPDVGNANDQIVRSSSRGSVLVLG